MLTCGFTIDSAYIYAAHQDGSLREIRSHDETALFTSTTTDRVLPTFMSIISQRASTSALLPLLPAYSTTDYFCSKLTVFFLLPAGLSEGNEELITNVIRKEPICSGELLVSSPDPTLSQGETVW